MAILLPCASQFNGQRSKLPPHHVEVLELRSLRDISPLSLSSTLLSAAALCRGMMQEGELRASTGSYNDADGDDVDLDDGNGRPP